MYLISLLVFLLAVSTVQPYSSCNRGKWNHARNLFNSLSNEVINHDHDIAETCKHFKQFSAKEVFGENAFRLEVPAFGFDYAVWDIKVRHRVIYICGHYPMQGKTCDLTYVDIRVLPHFANTHAAAWTYTNGMFIVAFPYKYDLATYQPSCSQDIDETLIDLRRGLPSERIFCDAC